jgi:hypothetical protein
MPAASNVYSMTNEELYTDPRGVAHYRKGCAVQLQEEYQFDWVPGIGGTPPGSEGSRGILSAINIRFLRNLEFTKDMVTLCPRQMCVADGIRHQLTTMEISMKGRSSVISGFLLFGSEDINGPKRCTIRKV